MLQRMTQKRNPMSQNEYINQACSCHCIIWASSIRNKMHFNVALFAVYVLEKPYISKYKT